MMDEQLLKEEIALFKENLTGQDGLLKSIRSLLIGLDVSDEEKTRIKAVFSNPLLRNSIRHRIYQLETDDVPLGAMNDVWMGLDTRLQGANSEAIKQAILVRSKLFTLFKNVESYLENPFQPKINLRIEPIIDLNIDFNELACDIMARNMYIKSVDMVLAIISNLTKEKGETPDQVIERLKKDSVR